MKTFLVVAVICSFVALSRQDAKEEFEQKVKQAKDACLKESGAKAELTEKMSQGEFPDDKNLKCYVKCMFSKFGYLTASGDFNDKFMKEHPRPGDDPAKVSAAVDKCKSPSGADACEKSYNLAKCLHGELKK